MCMYVYIHAEYKYDKYIHADCSAVHTYCTAYVVGLNVLSGVSTFSPVLLCYFYREREREKQEISLSIYICIYRERDRE